MITPIPSVTLKLVSDVNNAIDIALSETYVVRLDEVAVGDMEGLILGCDLRKQDIEAHKGKLIMKLRLDSSIFKQN